MKWKIQILLTILVSIGLLFGGIAFGVLWSKIDWSEMELPEGFRTSAWNHHEFTAKLSHIGFDKAPSGRITHTLLYFEDGNYTQIENHHIFQIGATYHVECDVLGEMEPYGTFDNIEIYKVSDT